MSPLDAAERFVEVLAGRGERGRIVLSMLRNGLITPQQASELTDACLEHSDCLASPELARACWEASR